MTNISLILGDCLAELPKIEYNTIDLVVTSPPYNAKKEYEDNLSLNDYANFAKEWVSYIPKLLTECGSFWLNVGYTKTGDNTTLPLTYLYYQLVDLPLIQEIVWHYEGGMAYKKRFTHRTERWMWFAKNPDNVIFNLDSVRDLENTKYINDKRNNPLGKNPTDYWFFNRVVGGNGATSEKKNHPCQFPEKMIDRIIKASSNKGSVVLDPFLGSGTTGVIAKKLERSFIGIEKDKNYFEIASSRINDE